MGEKEIEEYRETDMKTRLQRKEKFDAKKKTVEKSVKVGDCIGETEQVHNQTTFQPGSLFSGGS